MSLEVIYVTRHGFRSNWLVDPSTGDYTATIPSPTGIAADPALTAHGVDQARELGAALLRLDPPVEAVFSSPYYRCLQTITPFVEAHSASTQAARRGDDRAPGPGLPTPAARPTPTRTSAADRIRPELGLSEWYGDADFEHPRPAAPEVLKRMFPALDETYASVTAPPATGETVAQLHDRVAAVMQGLIERCDAEGLRSVVLCTHAAVVIALGRVLTGAMPDSIEVEDFRAFTCGLSVYRRRTRPATAPKSTGGALVAQHSSDTPLAWRGGRGVGGGWTCEVDSDCSFLSKGEERGWRFSGEESFKRTKDSAQDDAGIALGVVVEGGHSHRSAGPHHL